MAAALGTGLVLLLDEQVRLLEEDGIDWKPLPPFERKWREGLAAAKRHHVLHGNLSCAQSYIADDEFRLGSWLERKRRFPERLSPEKREALSVLGIRWSTQKKDT
ncbi:helicase associated domain-containing protein [Streptomyces sp. NPDC017991]|uniref:helicase associated domain-containing protein n=1 Tax=Streptomyces sp. NPDC017991 TaxID=3365026 RepID=UPI0037AE053D